MFTVKGKYTSRGWTEWTQGFQFGSALLQFDATGEERFLEIGRRKTIELMAPHVSHIGVHDHGFNNVSTYGNLWRLMREGKIPFNEREKDFYELALKVSGAVQAARWTTIADGGGYIYSFNGPHSLFVDTVRSLRSLAVAHQLGHVLHGERDQKISLLQRLLDHAADHRPLQHLLRRGPRRLRRARPHRPREHLQPQRRQLSLPQFAAGLLAVQHLDARPGLGHPGFAEQLEFLGTLNDEEAGQAASSAARLAPIARSATWPRIRSLFLEAATRDGRFLPRQLLRRRHPDVGHRRAEPASPGRLPQQAGRSVQPLGAGGQLRRRHRRAGPGPPGELSRRPRATRRAATAIARPA